MPSGGSAVEPSNLGFYNVSRSGVSEVDLRNGGKQRLYSAIAYMGIHEVRWTFCTFYIDINIIHEIYEKVLSISSLTWPQGLAQ